MYLDDLKKFIIELPQKLDFDLDDDSNHLVQLALYYASSNDGKYLKKWFPNISKRQLDVLKNYNIPHDVHLFGTPFYEKHLDSESGNYTHPPNRTCLRELIPGENVYRCEQCGYDNSCVLCYHCFNADDHIGHNVYIYSASTLGGGYCDCGDPEAFKNLNCKCQIPKGNSTSNGNNDAEVEQDVVEDDFQGALTETIRFCLEYILDVTNCDTLMLPFIHDNAGESSAIVREISNLSSLPQSKYGYNSQDVNSDNIWHLILWNDEIHNYPQIEHILGVCFGADRKAALDMAQTVNDNGRQIVQTSSDFNQLLKSQKELRKIAVVTTIISGRDYSRQIIIEQMISWILQISSSPNSPKAYPDFQGTFTSILAELLLEPHVTMATTFPIEIISPNLENLSQKCYENGLLIDNNEFPCNGLFKIRSEDYDGNELDKFWFQSASSVLERDNIDRKRNNFFDKSRVQYLMLFEIRFNKLVRKSLSKLLTATLISDTETKFEFARQLVQIYPNLLTSSALADREEGLNFLSSVDQQVLTCPATIKHILHLEEGRSLRYILGPLIDIIERYASSTNEEHMYNQYIFLPDGEEDRQNRKNRPLNAAILLGLRDFKYFVDKKSLDEEDFKFILNRDNTILIFLLLRFFQGMWSNTKKYGDHVEHESDDWTDCFNYIAIVLDIVKLIADSPVLENIPYKRFEVAKFFIKQAQSAVVSMISNGVANYKVSEETTSFINPIQSFISLLTRYKGFDQELKTFFKTEYSGPFMKISDFSLRSIVMASQIKIGFWVRNGYSVNMQSNHYLMGRNYGSYKRDLHLNQIASIVDQPKTTLFNFLERWELYEWFTSTDGKMKFDETIYEERFSSIVEEFVNFVYILITDRTNFYTGNDIRAKGLKNSICYNLLGGPLAYSRIKNLSEEYLISDSTLDFDSVLRSVASYQPPTGITDSGMYRLKDKCFSDLDAISLFLGTNKFQENWEVLSKHLEKKSQDTHGTGVTLEPKFTACDNAYANENLARFTKTKEFVKFLYRLIQAAIDNADETYLLQLLHLVHAILLDDLRLKGSDYLNEQFVIIPVCDLLLAIVDSTMSKPIIYKSEFLLNFLIERDERIMDSLIACFGESRVELYVSENADKANKESEAEKKKRIARERNFKVMNKFAKQREAFLEQNKDLGETISDKDKIQDENDSAEYRHCVMCGEEESKDRLFVLFTTIESQEFWKLPFTDVEQAKIAFQDWDNQESRKDNTEYGKGFQFKEKKSPREFGGTRKVFSSKVLTTCGHGIHNTCRLESPIMSRTKYSPCPICSDGWSLALPSPITPKGKGGFPIEKLNEPPKLTKYNQIIQSVQEDKSIAVLQYFGGHSSNDFLFEDYHRLMLFTTQETMKRLLNDKPHLPEYLKLPDAEYFNYVTYLSAIVGDTIKMHELSSRVEGGESYSEFLSDFPAESKSALKSLIQCRAYIMLNQGKYLASNINKTDITLKIEKFWETCDGLELSGVFTEVVVLFFQTEESFLTITRLGYTKLFILTIYSLLLRGLKSKKYFKSFPNVDDGGRSVPSATVTNLRNLIINFFPTFEGCESDENIAKLFLAVESCMLPFLRQLILFKDILTCTYVGHREWESVEDLKNLEDEIVCQNYLSSSEALTKNLNLKLLHDLIHSFTNVDDNDLDFALEKSVFNIVINAKIPKFLDKGILNLDYPGIVKLIDLPEELFSCISKLSTDRHDRKICLICGEIMPKESELVQFHTSKCSSHVQLLFQPKTSMLEIYRKYEHHGDTRPIALKIAAPYLTEHGEITKSFGQASLNHLRYRRFNKDWINHGLEKLIFRVLIGQSGGIRNANVNGFGLAPDQS